MVVEAAAPTPQEEDQAPRLLLGGKPQSTSPAQEFPRERAGHVGENRLSSWTGSWLYTHWLNGLGPDTDF